MVTWLAFALFALAVWSVQRVVTKIALVRWSTPYFYRLNAALSLIVYVPFVLFRPPDIAGLRGAFALSLLMALTFWVSTEATRRGPVGLVAPLTSLSPAITATLAIAVLGERPPSLALVGIGGSVLAGGLLAYRPAAPGALAGWLGLALVSLALQGFGAFFAKVVVTGPGPTDLLVTSAAVQLAVGAFIARREPIATERLSSRAGLVTALILVMAAVATIGYLYALSEGPASVIVPLVATSPALGGLLGILLLRERATGRQLAGIALGASAALLLASA